MQPKTPKLLEDIRDAAAFIGEATRGKTLDDYRRDRLLRQAMERKHGYDLIDHRLVWSTIVEEVPVLLTEVQTLLGRR
jgi:uncharacterized protein with HEPN domain